MWFFFLLFALFNGEFFFYGVRFIPVYFEKNIDSGIPTLTPAGQKAIEEELTAEYGDDV